ncbi:hypothetical protein CkaCkLH20_09731 [Colletotrichum karsti]|uniref:Uncharacterized protein n=1 Tax=Colletotrichum karsti TaxID=1095194 RepID=A0A9P6HXX3_9PEZI|nr:uncharacterized protein CkaCkLH20_09731 [Colletotrichum karsti]KAF9872868.1 hypothetical protein CkaCkLH20_09731 [Colletotrichum karsti]
MDSRLPFPRINYMLGQNYYYVPQCTWAYEDCVGMQWPGPYGSAIENVLYTLSDPLQTENLTACLLRNLQPCGPPTDTVESKLLAENLAKMPAEILDNILAMMGSDLPRVSSYLLPQAIWKEQLKAGSNGLLPWLWDIEPDLVDEKDAEAYGAGFEWDWELLVRQLTRGVDFGVRPEIPKDQPIGWRFKDFASTGYHSDLEHVPSGLHNRRRIWQLLEEMFVGDGLPWPRENEPVKERLTPLFWDKSGRILPSPIWIPLLDFGYDKSHNDRVFHRRLGGEVYRVEGLSKYPLQYWQKQGDKSSDTDKATFEQSATVQEIYGVLRSLGYPV